MFTREWKLTKKISSMTWPAQSSETNITVNVRPTTRLKLQSETDVYRLSAEYTNAVCKCWGLLPIGYILIVLCNYSTLDKFSNYGKINSTKYWPFEVRLVRLHIEYYGFCCLLLVYNLHTTAMLMTNLWPASVYWLVTYSYSTNRMCDCCYR